MRLYSRSDCPLCDEMRAEIGRARLSGPCTLDVVDIGTDPELEARFGRSIPVLEIAGRVAFKGRLTAPELERKFRRYTSVGRHAPGAKDDGGRG